MCVKKIKVYEYSMEVIWTNVMILVFLLIILNQSFCCMFHETYLYLYLQWRGGSEKTQVMTEFSFWEKSSFFCTCNKHQ